LKIDRRSDSVHLRLGLEALPAIDVKVDRIFDERARPVGLEFVEVAPQAKRTSKLQVHETLSRSPFIDAGSPPHGNTVQSETIIDEPACKDSSGAVEYGNEGSLATVVPDLTTVIADDLKWLIVLRLFLFNLKFKIIYL